MNTSDSTPLRYQSRRGGLLQEETRHGAVERILVSEMRDPGSTPGGVNPYFCAEQVPAIVPFFSNQDFVLRATLLLSEYFKKDHAFAQVNPCLRENNAVGDCSNDRLSLSIPPYEAPLLLICA